MKVTFSCVVDDNPKYARQALLWATSLLIFGHQSADSLVVHTVGEGDPRLRALLSSWGVDVVQVEVFDVRHRYSNKLAQFATTSLLNADYAVLCDCDVAFAGSIIPWLRGERIRARIAQRPWLPPAQWKAIFAAASLKLPTARASCQQRCTDAADVLQRWALYHTANAIWANWHRMAQVGPLAAGALGVARTAASFRRPGFLQSRL